jgi:hypothetical protein
MKNKGRPMTRGVVGEGSNGLKFINKNFFSNGDND